MTNLDIQDLQALQSIGIAREAELVHACTGLNVNLLDDAKRLRERGLCFIEDSPQGPMVTRSAKCSRLLQRLREKPTGPLMDHEREATWNPRLQVNEKTPENLEHPDALTKDVRWDAAKSNGDIQDLLETLGRKIRHHQRMWKAPKPTSSQGKRRIPPPGPRAADLLGPMDYCG